MSDGQDPNLNDDGTQVETDTTDTTNLTVEELKAELAKVRREAASRRVANKEKEKELEEFQKWKDSQKSELEKALERAKAAEEKAAKADLEKLQRKVAKDAGLDPELADRLIGDSEEELLADAKALAAKYKPSGAGATFAGRRGSAVTTGKTTSSTFNDFIRGNN